jgi:hypothetical protein
MEHARLKSANNVQFKVLCCKNSKIEEFHIFYFSFFACQILATVSFVDKVEDTIVYGTRVLSPSVLAFYPRPTRLWFTRIDFLQVLWFSHVRIMPPVIDISLHVSMTENTKLQKLTSSLEKNAPTPSMLRHSNTPVRIQYTTKSPQTLNTKAQQ